MEQIANCDRDHVLRASRRRRDATLDGRHAQDVNHEVYIAPTAEEDQAPTQMMLLAEF